MRRIEAGEADPQRNPVAMFNVYTDYELMAGARHPARRGTAIDALGVEIARPRLLLSAGELPQRFETVEISTGHFVAVDGIGEKLATLAGRTNRFPTSSDANDGVRQRAHEGAQSGARDKERQGT